LFARDGARPLERGTLAEVDLALVTDGEPFTGFETGDRLTDRFMTPRLLDATRVCLIVLSFDGK
jgi:hypothetical protein